MSRLIFLGGFFVLGMLVAYASAETGFIKYFSKSSHNHMDMFSSVATSTQNYDW